MTWLPTEGRAVSQPSSAQPPNPPRPGLTPAATIGPGLLLASGCGTAVAAVCASGLVALTQQAPGLWAVLAVLCGGALAFGLAHCLARLAEATPSSAGLIAYLARAFGRRAALLIALPYFLLSLFLVGAEATLAGQLASRLLPLPPLSLAVAFVVATWLLCRRGIQISLRAQALCTWALLTGLSLCALIRVCQAVAQGSLFASLTADSPSLSGFLAAVAQSLFLFMGFELVTSQTAPVPPGTLRRALLGSVGLLTAFYALLALALAAGDRSPLGPNATLPQLALAQQAAGLPAVATIALLSLLASYTSFNGALLAFSRLSAALASLGSLPRRWAQIDRGSLLPQRALSVLLGLCLLATVVVQRGDLLWPAIVAAAPAAALVYAALALARAALPSDQRSPKSRLRLARGAARMLAALFLGLAFAAPLSLFFPSEQSAAPPASPRTVLVILACAFFLSLAPALAQRRRRTQP
jgi:amino acid transporter